VSEKVTACISTLNEESNIAACVASVEGVDEVIVCDDGSTDETVEIAESLGAKVYRRHDHAVYTTAQQVLQFTQRFGWAPSFEAGTRIRNGHLESRECLSYATSDWVVVPDADERVSWDLERLKAEVMPIADQINGQFVHSHKEDGSPDRVARITKMFKRSVTVIDGRTHSCILPAGRIVTTDLMRVDHWQVLRPGRQSYVRPILEYSVLVDDDQRSRFYLGREYYYHREHEKALTLLNLYLEDATWMPEIAKARQYAARCYWETGRGDKAREECLQAVLLNPDDQESLYLMSEVYFSPWKEKWAYIADNARNTDILF
jgi:glycosyltransferase involved in cell wall biosynthesis